MPAPLSWETVLRGGIAHSLAQRGCRSGWSVAAYRGLTRLNVSAAAAGGRRRQLLLPIPWQPDQVDDIREVVLQLHDAVQRGEDLQEAFQRLPLAAVKRSSSTAQPGSSEGAQQPPVAHLGEQPFVQWSGLLEAFRTHKIRSGEIKPATWTRMYEPRMALLLQLLEQRVAPTDASELFTAVADHWGDRPGCRTRQIQVQYTAALLRWLVQQGHLGEAWSPPQDLSAFVGRSREQKVITTPIGVEHILALAQALPDPRWQLCFQLISAYGLRPEEIQHLERRGDRLWCLYEKVSPKGKTKPRPLRLLPSDHWAEAWDLERRYDPARLPPMRPGHVAQDITQYLRRRPLWQQLRREYEAQGEKLVLYSCRHAYAHRAHVICELPPKVVAAAMGHSVQTHLAAYSRWCGDEVIDDAFNRAAERMKSAIENSTQSH